MRIKVDHQLQRTAQMQYVIEEPKLTKVFAMCRWRKLSQRVFAELLPTERHQKLNRWWKDTQDFYFWIKTICRWLPFTGRSTWSISFRNTTGFTVSRCRKLPLMYAGTPFALIWQIRDESENLAVYHGSRRHQCNLEHLHPCEFWWCKGRSISDSE